MIQMYCALLGYGCDGYVGRLTVPLGDVSVSIGGCEGEVVAVVVVAVVVAVVEVVAVVAVVGGAVVARG